MAGRQNGGDSVHNDFGLFPTDERRSSHQKPKPSWTWTRVGLQAEGCLQCWTILGVLDCSVLLGEYAAWFCTEDKGYGQLAPHCEPQDRNKPRTSRQCRLQMWKDSILIVYLE